MLVRHLFKNNRKSFTQKKRFFLNKRRLFSTQSTGRKVHIVSGKRTPFGKFDGSLKEVGVVDLAVIASKATLDAIKVEPKELDHVVFANVLPSTVDVIYGARHLSLKLGCPIPTPSFAVNRLCGSGIQAIAEAFNMIMLGQSNVVLTSGSENMSMAPHLVYGARFGTRFGPLKTVDMLMDALTDSYCKTPMAITAENLSKEYNVTREDCDVYSLNSHKKTAEAYKNNLLQGEIVPVPLKKGVLEKDEHVRYDCNIEDMSKLKATFQKDGVVTAGTASGIVDGASSVLLVSDKYLKEKNLSSLAVVLDWVAVGVKPELMGYGPVDAINLILKRNKLSLKEIDLVEINEAFAGQTLSCMKALNLEPSKLNIWGGAVAMGHPLGATGTRITFTLVRQLRKKGLKLGIASACIGGGQGIAMLVRIE